MPQRVLGPHEEIDLALEELDRLRVPALERREMPGADVAAGDEQPLAPGEERLLELHRPRGRPFASIEFAEERRAMRELQRVPAGVRVPLERAVEPLGRLAKPGLADEQRAPHRANRTGVVRIDRERAAERRHPLHVLADGDQRIAQLAPRAPGTRLELERAPQACQRRGR